MLQSSIGVVTVVISLASRVPYFRDAINGRTKPHVFSWLVWTVTMAVVAAAQLVGGAGPGAWAAVCAAIANLAILLVAIDQRDLHATKLDWASLWACILAAIGWLLTDQALVAIVMLSLLEVFAILPTIRKSWHRPNEETVSLYSLSLVCHLLSLFALERFTAVTATYAIVLVLINTAMTATLMIRRTRPAFPAPGDRV